MRTQKLTLNQLMQDAEVIEKENLNTIKGGITAGQLLDAIAMDGVDAYVGKYEFGNGGGSDATNFSFDRSTIAFINAELGIGGGGGGGYTSGFAAYGGQGSYNNPIQLNEVTINGKYEPYPIIRWEGLPDFANPNYYHYTGGGFDNPHYGYEWYDCPVENPPASPVEDALKKSIESMQSDETNNEGQFGEIFFKVMSHLFEI